MAPSLVRLVPRYAFLTAGKGHDGHPLAAFDAALRDAGIASQNLVPVSSVFPPGCKLISRAEGTKKLKAGAITFCVMARYESNETGQQIAAALGVALPSDGTHYGYLAEHHADGQTASAAGKFAEQLAVKLLGAKLGVDPKHLDVSRRLSVAAATRVPKGRWASVVAVCVFVLWRPWSS